MGFFSWKTSDTKKNIRNVHTGRCKTVYLLQPNGKPPIKEDAYDGYGVFSGVDAYVWLAKMNLPQDASKRFSEDDLRSIGISLECGDVLRMEDGKLFAVFHGSAEMFNAMGLDVVAFPGRWDDPLPGETLSANELVQLGRAKIVRIANLVQIRYPLKFSFDETARYEDLPAAETDPDQGLF